MPILYALVSRGEIVLAEYTSKSGNFPTITRVLLGKIKSSANGKMSYIYDQYAFHYIVENSLIYLCLCDDLTQRRVPFAFLEDLKDRFQSKYGDKALTVIAYAFSNEFSPVIQKQMDYFNSSDPVDTISSLHAKIEDVKSVMVKNIELVMERGEKLELLVEKSDLLQSEAFKFERQSMSLRNVMWWRRARLVMIIVTVIFIVVFIFAAVICNIDFSRCK
jgi:vesicle-associated membrane protein 7